MKTVAVCVLLVSLGSAQCGQFEVEAVPPTFVQPPAMADMMDLVRKSMERMMDIVPSVLEAAAAQRGATNRSETDNASSGEPGRLDVAIDIELMPLMVPMHLMKRAEANGTETTTNNSSRFAGGNRGMVIVEMVNAEKVAPKANDSSKGNASLTWPPMQASKRDVTETVQEGNTTSGEANSSSQDASPRGAPSVLASQMKPSETRPANTSWGTANAMAPSEGFRAACYGLFLRHGLVLLALAVVCGISCLLGTLLPVICDRKGSGNRSQFPSKKYWSPRRIFADPVLVRMFQRRETMMA